ncbi:MAG TPA: HD-GYP domain-containing protein [Humidesulfovibrio sp.]|uniref:HD-GYP domain-containing protein n=1 Tax=Humidesulfovibrio sp. TaxID=2910988 RepID=UPI002BA7B437|nr:HD-GYP domain-containing protein [Humidesulfovibrio sp.]HWR03824.1 HD-GYP domain-containing protein [Humidesulfovibrio sp.]
MTVVQPSRKRLVASLHRLLVWRLLGMTALICALFAGATYVQLYANYDEAILESSMSGAEDFRELILPQLDAPGRLDAKAVQAALDSLSGGLRRPSLGFTASARILDADSKVVAQRSATSYALAAQVAQYLSAHGYVFRPGQAVQSRSLVLIGGKPHVHLAVSLVNSRGQVAAYGESVYAVSQLVQDNIRKSMLGTVGLVVLVVLATSLLLYPVIIRLLRRVTRLSVHLQEANLETLRVLGSAIAKRDSDTDRHNYRVTIYTVRLAEALELPGAAIRSLVKGGMLHDVGKIGIRDAVLLKPGGLTDGEYRVMQTHVQHGRDIVAQASWLSDALPVISGHHERYDGNGYDHGLAGTDIPLGARVFALADVFDALTSRRPYKEPYAFEEAMRLLELERGTHFDPAVFDVFRRIARGLYDSVAGCGDDELHETLRQIFQTYFIGDIETMMEGMEELVSGRKAGAETPAKPS